jgi:TRAP-type C4-dicarboxylate transport system substrate-binding protein
MLRFVVRAVVTLLVLLPRIAAAEPIKLKLAFFSSDRSALYQAGVKPFVNAVNLAAKDLVHIDVYFSSTLCKVDEEPKLLLDGTIDIAFMTPGYTPELFYDDAVVELPGLFESAREATIVYTKLATQHIFKSYEKFVVLGTFASEPESIHSRTPIASVTDLKGLKIRANNVAEAAALEKLGAMPVLLAINKTSQALSLGTIDGAMAPPAMLFEFGIGRVTANHYMIRGSAALMLLAMNRETFEKLPAAAQQIILRYSGEWAALHYVATIEALNAAVLEQLKPDPKRKLVFPAPADRAIAQSAFNRVAEEWAGEDVDKAKRLKLLRTELTTLRFTDE